MIHMIAIYYICNHIALEKSKLPVTEFSPIVDEVPILQPLAFAPAFRDLF